jgi:hypothetical protein
LRCGSLTIDAMSNKNTAIVIEINERIVVKNAEQQFEAYCPECKKITEMATLKTAGALIGISEREVFRLIEGKQIHFLENAMVLVCVDSVRKLRANSNITSP